jgi:hypothetical protein
MSNANEPTSAAEQQAIACSSGRFVCRSVEAEFCWSYHDERGRLLVRGPSHAELWQAHRLLLAAIQDEAASGSMFAPDEDEEAGMKTDQSHESEDDIGRSVQRKPIRCQTESHSRSATEGVPYSRSRSATEGVPYSRSRSATEGVPYSA